MTSTGTTILSLVQQDEKWRTGEGEVVLVDSMTPSHLASVLRVLVSMEAELYGAWLEEGAGGSVPLGVTPGQPVDAGSVRAWFDALALVVRIRALLAEHNRVKRQARSVRPRAVPDPTVADVSGVTDVADEETVPVA
jgi:hypothetical protein